MLYCKIAIGIFKFYLNFLWFELFVKYEFFKKVAVYFSIEYVVYRFCFKDEGRYKRKR